MIALLVFGFMYLRLLQRFANAFRRRLRCAANLGSRSNAAIPDASLTAKHFCRNAVQSFL